MIALFAMAALDGTRGELGSLWEISDCPDCRVVRRYHKVSSCTAETQGRRWFRHYVLEYDLPAQRWVRYAYIYPFAEALAGVLMMAGALMWLSIPIALFIGGIGAVSVFKAVYIDKRESKCTCIGGDSNVPLGFVSLTENLMMVAMAIWMIFKPMGVTH